MYRLLLLAGGWLFFACGNTDTTPGALPTDPTFRDASANVDDRLNDLIGYMTVEEKVAQMLCIWQE